MSYFKQDYNGDLIHKRFGYEYFKKDYDPLGVIIAFRGNMDVTDNLIDLEDKLNNDYIYSEDALNFCWEIPNICPIGAVFFQRLFARYIGDELANGYYGKFEVKVDGDDIMIRKPGDEEYGKASVSITKVIDGNVAIGHLGLNIKAGPKAPSFAFSLLLDDANASYLTNRIKAIFQETIKDCFVATTKVII
jgi:hypothetical protein